MPEGRITCVQLDCWLVPDANKWKTIRRMRRHAETTGHRRWVFNGRELTLKEVEEVLTNEKRYREQNGTRGRGRR